jgi:hypothetical protein
MPLRPQLVSGRQLLHDAARARSQTTAEDESVERAAAVRRVESQQIRLLQTAMQQMPNAADRSVSYERHRVKREADMLATMRELAENAAESCRIMKAADARATEAQAHAERSQRINVVLGVLALLTTVAALAHLAG